MSKNIFRQQYRDLTPNEKSRIERIKEKADALYAELQTVEKSDQTRELSLAKTKLEESVMWATKAITK